MRTVGLGSLETEADRVSKFEYIVNLLVTLQKNVQTGRRGWGWKRPYCAIVTRTPPYDTFSPAEQLYFFAGFDNTCDLSAVLGILGNASVFHAHV